MSDPNHPSGNRDDVTVWLRRAEEGDERALDQVFPALRVDLPLLFHVLVVLEDAPRTGMVVGGIVEQGAAEEYVAGLEGRGSGYVCAHCSLLSVQSRLKPAPTVRSTFEAMYSGNRGSSDRPASAKR